MPGTQTTHHIWVGALTLAGLGLLAVLVWIVVKSLTPRQLARGPSCNGLAQLPGTMVCQEQYSSAGWRVDVNADGVNYGYVWQADCNTSLTRVTFQMVPSAHDAVAWVRATSDRWRCETTYDFDACTPGGSAYQLAEAFEPGTLQGESFAQFTVTRDGSVVAATSRSSVLVDDLQITSPDASDVYATLSPDLVASSVIGTYNVTNRRPDLLDNWFVAFVGALVILRTRQQQQQQQQQQQRLPAVV